MLARGGEDGITSQLHKNIKDSEAFLFFCQRVIQLHPGLASCFLTITIIIAHEASVSQNYF